MQGKRTKAIFWWTRADAAFMCDMTIRNFDMTVRKRMPADALKGTGASLRFYGVDVVAAYIDHSLAVRGLPNNRCSHCGKFPVHPNNDD